MYPGSAGLAQGTISAQNVGAPNGNAVTNNSTVTLDLQGGSYDTGIIQVTGTYTGALSVQATIDGNAWITLGGTTALININTAGPSANIASATQGIFQCDVSGFQKIRVTALAAVTGSAVVSLTATAGNGVVGIDTPVILGGGSSNVGIFGTPGGTLHTLLAAATTNATAVKTSAGNLFEVVLTNLSATVRYVKFYDKASAPTVGTDLPIMTIEVPANSSKPLMFGQIGKRFNAGIAMAFTANQASADTTAVVAGDLRTHMTYI